jgi:Protein of unknown function (DUF4233)
MRAPRRTLAAATVSIEAFVVFFAGLVAKDLSSLSTGAALGLFSGLAVACLLTAGLLRRAWGYAFGWAVQAAVVASGFLVPVMFFLGGVFAVLWWLALSQGARIEREREAYAREHGA